jgi:hypothetical protein
MVQQALVSVFAHAAVPQKIVLILLVAAIPATALAAALALKGNETSPWRRLIADLRLVGPALGLLVGAMNSFHMGQTIQRIPFDPTAKQLAPGILEVSALVGLGALVGVVAAVAHVALALAADRGRAGS